MTAYKKYKYKKKYGTKKTSFSLGKKYKYQKKKSKGTPYKKYKKSKSKPTPYKKQIYKDLKNKPRFTYKKPKTWLGRYAYKKIIKPYNTDPKKRKLMMTAAESYIASRLFKIPAAFTYPEIVDYSTQQILDRYVDTPSFESDYSWSNSFEYRNPEAVYQNPVSWEELRNFELP